MPELGAEATGQKLGRYHLVQPIGGGPTGEVFRAKVYGVAGLEREFAVKRFHPDYVKKPQAAEFVARSARVYGSLDHPRIARMHEFGTAGGETFAATELVAGVDGARLISGSFGAGAALSPGAALALIVQASRALGYAHGRGVYHLGLCPTNLICGPGGNAKVTDVGFLPARIPPKPSEDFTLLARIPYLAPEQLVAEDTSAATDVFQLGVLLYEVLTGTKPFRGQSPLDITQAILSAQPELPDVPKPIQKVVQRTLARSPLERFPDASALADALEAAARSTTLPGGKRDLSAKVRDVIEHMSQMGELEVSGAFAFPLPAPPAADENVRPEDGWDDGPHRSDEQTASDETTRPAPNRGEAGRRKSRSTVLGIGGAILRLTNNADEIAAARQVLPSGTPSPETAVDDDALTDVRELPDGAAVAPSGQQTPLPPPLPAEAIDMGLDRAGEADADPMEEALREAGLMVTGVEPDDQVVSDSLTSDDLTEERPAPFMSADGPLPEVELVAMHVDSSGAASGEAKSDGALADDSDSGAYDDDLTERVEVLEPGDALADEEGDELAGEEGEEDLLDGESDAELAGEEGEEDLLDGESDAELAGEEGEEDLLDGESDAELAGEEGEEDLLDGESDAELAGEEGEEDLLDGESDAELAGEEGEEDLLDGESDAELAGEEGEELGDELGDEDLSDAVPLGDEDLEFLDDGFEPKLAEDPAGPPEADLVTFAGDEMSPLDAVDFGANSAAAPRERRERPKWLIPAAVGALVVGVGLIGARLVLSDGGDTTAGSRANTAVSDSGLGEVTPAVANVPPQLDPPGPLADAIAVVQAVGSDGGPAEAVWDAALAPPVVAATAPADAGAAVAAPADAAPAVVAVATAPADAAASGTLVIRSEPAGAKAYLDGTPIGRTPIELEKAPDAHQLALILPGYKLFTQSLEGNGEVAAVLEETSPPGGPAGIKVRCRKKNRYYVFVDGDDTGQLCPTERLGVSLGKHVVEIYDPLTESRRTFRAHVKETRLSLRVRVD